MKTIELTGSDAIFVYYVLRLYASQTKGLDREDRVGIRELAEKFDQL